MSDGDFVGSETHEDGKNEKLAFQDAKNFLPQSIVVVDSDLRVRYASGELDSSSDTAGKDISGCALNELALPEDFKNIWMSKVQDVFDSGLGTEFEFDLDTQNNNSLKWSLYPESLGEGKSGDVITISQNVSAANESVKSYKALFENMQDGFAVQELLYDETGEPIDARYVDVNPAFLKLVDKKRSEVIGHTMSELTPIVSKKWVKKCFGITKSGGAKVFEGYVASYGKHLKTTVYSPLPNFLACVVVDIGETISAERERRLLEEELLHSQKLEAISSLAGGIAHDFNNYLQGILGQTELLSVKCEEPCISEGLEIIDRAARRASELTQQLLGFARRGKLADEEINLHRILNEALSAQKPQLAAGINLECDIVANYHIMFGDAKQLSKALTHLLRNAIEATGEEGEIVIKTKNISTEDMRLLERRTLKYQEHIVISIKDSGVGMSANKKKHIFEPFYSTKSSRRSVGMGLAMSYGIVRSHEGIIEVDSSIGEGSEFRVILPVTKKRPKATVETKPSVEVQKGVGNILVVDDQEVARKTLSAMLEHLGYSVVMASSGVEAIDYFSQNANRFDLVLLDVNMPIINGQETFEHLKDIRPDVSVIMMTGHAVSSLVSNAIESGILCVLQKPFSLSAVSKVVAQAIT